MKKESNYSKEYCQSEVDRYSVMMDDILCGRLEGDVDKVKEEIIFFQKELIKYYNNEA